MCNLSLSSYICLFVSGNPISSGNSKQVGLIVAKGNETRSTICFVRARCFVIAFRCGLTLAQAATGMQFYVSSL